MGPYTGGNVSRVLKVRSVQEMEGEASTGGGPSTGGGEERPVQEVV
jgi:hypothetical protein